MPDFLKDNLVLIVISVITGLPATLYSFTSHLGLGFVFADIVVGVLLLFLAVSWLWSANLSFKKTTSDLFGDLSLKARWNHLSGTKRTEITARGVIGLAVASYAIFVLSMPPIAVATMEWEVCGTLRGGCSPMTCLQLKDVRGRTTGDTCNRVDASGFFRERSSNWPSYPPRAVRLSCGTDVYSADVRPVTDPASQCGKTISLRRIE